MEAEALVKPAILVVIATLIVVAKQSAKEPNIDGRILKGYESAVAFLRNDPHKKRPFEITNYVVTFEKGYRYYFQAKVGPDYKPWPGLSTDLGTTVRIYVDEKTLKVKQAVVE